MTDLHLDKTPYPSGVILSLDLSIAGIFGHMKTEWSVTILLRPKCSRKLNESIASSHSSRKAGDLGSFEVVAWRTISGVAQDEANRVTSILVGDGSFFCKRS
jgi:hypothetical protein